MSTTGESKPALRVAVAGASGRMGQEIQRLLQGQPTRWGLAGTLSRKDRGPLGSDVCDVVIDFSLPEGTPELVERCAAGHRPLVSGVTGLSAQQMHALRAQSQKIPIFWAPNMSIGVAVMRLMIRQMRDLSGYDFALTESHHILKKDKPSGTALLLEKTLRETIGRETEILSVRGGGILGEHEVRAMGPEEIISVSHVALSRAVFARGALVAAEWLVGQRPGFYGMDDLLTSVGAD